MLVKQLDFCGDCIRNIQFSVESRNERNGWIFAQPCVAHTAPTVNACEHGVVRGARVVVDAALTSKRVCEKKCVSLSFLTKRFVKDHDTNAKACINFHFVMFINASNRWIRSDGQYFVTMLFLVKMLTINST